MRKELKNRDVSSGSLPSVSRSSYALTMPLSKARASAAVWNVSPLRCLPARQWWNVGITLKYCRSRLMTQLRMTVWSEMRCPKITHSYSCPCPLASGGSFVRFRMETCARPPPDIGSHPSVLSSLVITCARTLTRKSL